MKEGEIKFDRVTWLGGFGILALLAIMASGLLAPRMGHGPGVRTRAIAAGLESALGSFEEEYGHLPDVGSNAFDCDDAQGCLLARILLGKEDDGSQAQNPRKLPFLSVGITKSAARAGLLIGTEGEVLGIYDGWGEPFEILLRKPGERGITLVHRGKTVTLEQPAVVFSKGKDRIAGTKDDVRTWE